MGDEGNGEGSNGEGGNWYDGLPQELHSAVSKYTSVEELAKGHVNQSKLLGRSLTFPTDDASNTDKDEAFARIYGKLGRPENSAGYEIAKPENIAEGLGWSDELAETYKQHCFKQNKTQAQAKADIQFYHDLRLREIERIRDAQEKVAAESTVALKSEVGEDKFEAFLANAQKAYEKCGGDELIELFDKMGLKNHPVIVKAFNRIYEKELAEDTTVGSSAHTKSAPGVFSNEFYATPQEKAL